MFKDKPNHELCVWALFLFGLVGIPGLYFSGSISIDTVNMLGRYLAFAIAAIGLDLIWGYCGVLSLCQALFFALGGYAMGMYLAHHGGPEGIIDKDGWKLPACLFVVYPYDVGEAPGDAMVPWFWKPFYNLPLTVLLGVALPGAVAAVIGYFGFRSRVRGVYFAILTQAITVAGWLVFCMNNMKLCGTNGLTRFNTIAGFELSSHGVKFGLYLLTLVCLIGVFCLCRFLVSTRLGRVLVAVRDDETNLRFFGYKPYMFKMFVFALAAALGGLGGMLYTPQMGIITPEYMTAKWSILFVIWVAVGGRGTLSGAVLGALGVNLVYNFLTTRWPEAWPFVQGLLFVGVVLLFPKGIAGLLELTFLKRLAKRQGSDMHEEPQYDSPPPDPKMPWCLKCEAHTPYHVKWGTSWEGFKQKIMICDLCDGYLMKPATISIVVYVLLVFTILLGICCVALLLMGMDYLNAERSLVEPLLGFIAFSCISVVPCFLFYRFYKKKKTRWLAFVSKHGRGAKA